MGTTIRTELQGLKPEILAAINEGNLAINNNPFSPNFYRQRTKCYATSTGAMAAGAVGFSAFPVATILAIAEVGGLSRESIGAHLGESFAVIGAIILTLAILGAITGYTLSKNAELSSTTVEIENSKHVQYGTGPSS